MPDFGLVPHALLSPSQCVACRTHADPHGFVDLVAELPAYGRVYVCAGCLGMAAGRLGWVDPRVAGEMAEGLRAAEAHGRELTLELERANGRGKWTWTVADALAAADADPLEGVPVRHLDTACPDCGGAKNATSKRCRDCHTKTLHAPKAGATA
jgi:hypothetical protein